MAYDKNTWIDQSVERPRTYEMHDNADGSITLVDSPGLVSELGTPVNAANMNHIEEGIAACDLRKYNTTEIFEKNEWATAIVKGDKKIFQSLKDGNQGNPITNTTWWTELNLGSAGGTSLPLFSPVIQDHVLGFEESKGYALQGTYVYKESAPERYGYPDFYAKCLEEKAAGVETETTLGDSTITTYNNANGHIYYDIADKATVDTFFETYGVAWMYGVDEENERIFLPRQTLYNMKSTAPVAVYGDGQTIGLTNTAKNFGLGTKSGGDLNAWDGIYGASVASANPTGDNAVGIYGVTPDSTKSGIVGTADFSTFKSDNKYLYICVGNTEQTESITEVTEVTTSENDTIPMFTAMYFDFVPNSPSWLKSGTQQNSGNIYTSCYNTLVNCLTEANNIYNLKVIEESAMVAGVDYSEYWKVNQDEEYFITPTALSYKALSGGVKGNGMATGITNGTKDFYLSSTTSTGLSASPTQTNVGTAVVPEDQGRVALGITTDSTKSGIIAEESTAQLYFKVANAVQNLELLDAGQVLEALSEKISREEMKVYITETYVNETSGYNVYSNGYCEQWGKRAGGGSQTINLLKTFRDSNYNVLTNICISETSTTLSSWVASRANDSFTVQNGYGDKYNSNYQYPLSWRACGYLAEGEY